MWLIKMIKIVQIICMDIPVNISVPVIFPIYILNGKSLTYWNGKSDEILPITSGKNGIGIAIPLSISPIVVKIFETPFSFNVFKTITGFNVESST